MALTIKSPLLKNLLYYSSGIILPGALSFLFIPFVVNLFGASAYAQYSLAFNTLNVVSMFCYGWIGQSYIRFYTHYPGFFLQKALQLLKKSMLLGFVVFILSEIFFSGAAISSILFFIPSFFLAGYYNFFLIMCQAHQKSKRVAASELLRTAVNLLLPMLFFFFFKTNYGLQLLAVSLLFSYLIPLIIFFRKTRKENTMHVAEIMETTPHEMQQQVLSYGIPIAFFLSLALALSVNDRFIVAKIMGYNAAGSYASIYDILSRGITMFCAAILMAFFPHIAALYNSGDTKGAAKNIRRAFYIEAAVFAAGFIFIFFFGVAAMNMLFRKNISQDNLNIMLLIYSGVFAWQFGILLHKPLELKKKTKLMATGVAIAFLFNISANIFLLARYRTLFIPALTTLLASLVYIGFIAGYLIFAREKTTGKIII